MTFIVHNDGANPPRITEVPALPTLLAYVDAAEHIASAGDELEEARSVLLGVEDGMAEAVNHLIGIMGTFAVDLSLAAEPHDPDDEVGKVFAHSVFSGKLTSEEGTS